MERKKSVLDMLLKSDKPLSGTELAEKCGVTRQVIVKDIALLRAEGNNIYSTPKGYVAEKSLSSVIRREIKVCHGEDKIRDELETIVDLGGRALNTFIDHPAYGYFGEVLNVKSRKDIESFIDKIVSTGCAPLLKLTNGEHIHMVEADNEETMNEIISALDEKGYLIK